MKRCFHIGILMLALAMLAGCNPKPEIAGRHLPKVPEPVEGPSHVLCAIDSLMWHHPDSAFNLLLEFADSPQADSLDGFEGHYFQLLVAELLYKNDYMQSNRNDLLQSVAYFDSLTRNVNDTHRTHHLHRGLDPRSPSRNDDLVFLAARAHYINGVGYYERDSVVEACGEYLTALETMEGHFEEKALTGMKAQFMAYSFNRLGDMFSEQFMMDPSIACYEKSLTYCKIEPTSLHGKSNTLFRIGKQYDKKNETDKAKWYYEQALEGMKGSDSFLSRDIISSKSVCDYQLGREFEQVMEDLRIVVAHSANEEERLNRYLTLGSLFYEEGIYDSVLYYLVPVFERSNSRLFRIQSAEYLRSVYYEVREQEKADACARFLADHKKTDGENKALVSRLEDLFNAYVSHKQERQAEETRKKSIKKTVGVIVPIAIVVALTIIVMSKRKSRRLLKEHQAEADRILGKTEQQHKEELKQRQAQTEKLLEDKENTSRQMSDMLYARLRAMQQLDYCLKTPKDKIALKDLEREVFGTGDHWEAIKEVLVALYPGLWETLKLKYPGMDEMELRVSMLSQLKLSRLAESTLLGVSTSVLDKLRTKVRKTMTEEESSDFNP